MAGVLSRLSATARSTTRLSANPRLATLLSSATAGPVRRLHGHLPSTPPELPSWVKEEVRKLVREVVAEETRGMKGLCLERFDYLCTRTIALAKDAAKLHGETMVMHIETKKELTKIAFRIVVSVGGIAVASPFFRAAASGDGGSGGGPPSRAEVVELVKQEAENTKEEILKTLALDLQVIAAKHFLSEQNREENSNP